VFESLGVAPEALLEPDAVPEDVEAVESMVSDEPPVNAELEADDPEEREASREPRAVAESPGLTEPSDCLESPALAGPSESELVPADPEALSEFVASDLEERSNQAGCALPELSEPFASEWFPVEPARLPPRRSPRESGEPHRSARSPALRWLEITDSNDLAGSSDFDVPDEPGEAGLDAPDSARLSGVSGMESSVTCV